MAAGSRRAGVPLGRMTTATMKDWQHGIDLRRLKDIAALYAHHDGPYVSGAFVRMSETMIAEALHDRRLIVLDDDDGTPRAAVEIVTAHTPRHVDDWAGRWASVASGAHVVRRPVYRTPADREDLRRTIAHAVDADTWFEVFIECPSCVALAESFGGSYVTTKIRASAELVGVFHASSEMFPPAVRPPDEVASLVRLNIPPFDTSAVSDAIDALGLRWADHYSTYNVRHSWSALALRGYGGDPDFIIKPAEMSKKWKADHPDEMTWRIEDTPLRDILTECEPIIDAIPGDPDRIRLMRLTPGGGELTRHADITDPDAGVADGRLMRVHVPIVTNPHVRFWSWMPDGTMIERHMDRGETWYLDTRKPHRALNAGTTDRIHLVLDIRANPAIRKLLEI